MSHAKKSYNVSIYIRGGVTAALALACALTFVFDPARTDARAARYAWLNPKYKADAAFITVRGADGDGEVSLEKNAGLWQVVVEDKRYPAKESFVDELLDALSKTGAYPVRSKTDASHKKLGLDENAAKRVLVKTASGSPLLDLLIGGTDTTGKRYMRKNGAAETRAGADNLRGFGARADSYYDLRLFPGHDAEGLTVAAVQRILADPPADGAGGGETPPEPWTLARKDAGWHVEGRDDLALDTVQVEQYVRSVLDAAAEDFLPGLSASDEPFNAPGRVPGRLIIQTGDGKERRITLAPKSGDRRAAAVEGRDFVFALSDWTANQLFKSYDAMKD